MQLSNKIAAVERRRKVRYTIELVARYRTIGRGKPIAGIARTQNISSCGALLIAEDEIPVGRWVEIAMEWPFLLDGSMPLQLTAKGRVVRGQGRSLAISLENIQFRILKRRIEQRMAAAGGA